MAKWSEYVEKDTTYDRETDETVKLEQRHKVSKWRAVGRIRGRTVIVHHEGDVLMYTGSGDIRPRVTLECRRCTGLYTVLERDMDCRLVHVNDVEHTLIRDGA